MSITNKYGLPPLWLNVVADFELADRIPLGQIAPQVGMSNGNLTITKITDKSLVCRTSEGGRRLTKHFTIDAAEARKWGWDGDVPARRSLSLQSTREWHDEFEKKYGVPTPTYNGHSVFRVDAYPYRRDLAVLPLYSVDGAEPVAIEAAVKLVGIK